MGWPFLILPTFILLLSVWSIILVVVFLPFIPHFAQSGFFSENLWYVFCMGCWNTTRHKTFQQYLLPPFLLYWMLYLRFSFGVFYFFSSISKVSWFILHGKFRFMSFDISISNLRITSFMFPLFVRVLLFCKIFFVSRLNLLSLYFFGQSILWI